MIVDSLSGDAIPREAKNASTADTKWLAITTPTTVVAWRKRLSLSEMSSAKRSRPAVLPLQSHRKPVW